MWQLFWGSYVFVVLYKKKTVYVQNIFFLFHFILKFCICLVLTMCKGTRNTLSYPKIKRTLTLTELINRCQFLKTFKNSRRLKKTFSTAHYDHFVRYITIFILMIFFPNVIYIKYIKIGLFFFQILYETFK